MDVAPGAISGLDGIGLGISGWYRVWSFNSSSIPLTKLEGLHLCNVFALQPLNCECHFEEEISRIEFLEPNQHLPEFCQAENRWVI